MAEYVKKLALDFNAEYPIQTVFAKQLDENSRFLLIEPQLDGNKFDVRGCDVQLYAKAADETVKAISGAVNESGEILFDLTDIISSSEIFVCDAKILGNGRMLSSCLFFINVKQSILWSNKIKLYRNSAYSDIVQIKNDGEYYTTGYIPVKANVPITVSPYRNLMYCDADKVRYASEPYEATTISEITPAQDGYIIFCFRKAVTQVFASVSSESTVYTEYGYTVGDFLEEYVTSYDKLYEKLNGKTVYNIGDSVADGAGNPIYENGVKVGYSSYADILANKYSMILTKYSQAGATFGWRSVSQASKRLNIITQVMDFCALGGSPDIIFIAGGINDTTNSISKGNMLENYQAIRDNTVNMLGADLTDTTVKPTVNFTNPSHNFDIDTTCGAFEWCISMLRYYFPNAIVVYIREHIMGSKSWEQTTYQDEIEKCCSKCGVAVVKTELNTYFYSSFTDVDGHREYTGGMADYTSDSNNTYHDGTHPNQLGYEKYYLPPIEECLRSLIKG